MGGLELGRTTSRGSGRERERQRRLRAQASFALAEAIGAVEEAVGATAGIAQGRVDRDTDEVQAWLREAAAGRGSGLPPNLSAPELAAAGASVHGALGGTAGLHDEVVKLGEASAQLEVSIGALARAAAGACDRAGMDASQHVGGLLPPGPLRGALRGRVDDGGAGSHRAGNKPRPRSHPKARRRAKRAVRRLR